MDCSKYELLVHFHQQNMQISYRYNRLEITQVLQELRSKRRLNDSCRIQDHL